MIKIAAPVYKFDNENSPYFIILHKSTKYREQLGIWQTTFFNKFEKDNIPTGDSEFASYDDALQYLEDQGYFLVEKVEDQQKINASFNFKNSVGIVDGYYEKNGADKRSPSIARDTANITVVDRNEPGDPTERGEITQLEDEKDGDNTRNRTQEH